MARDQSIFLDVIWLHKDDPIPVQIAFHSLYMTLATTAVGSEIEEFDILFENIDFCEKFNMNGSYAVLIHLKDLRIFNLKVSRLPENFFNVLERNILSTNREELDDSTLIAFKYPKDVSNQELDGWNLVDLEAEMEQIVDRNAKLRISKVNVDYKICTNYPHLVVVPSSMDDSVVMKISSFRENSCFPICVYSCKNNMSMLIRSSQPLLLKKREYMDDVRYLNSFSPNNKNWILDLRSQGDIKTNEQNGGGKEIQEYCPFWKIFVVSMEKTSKLINKFEDVVRASSDASKFYPRVVDSDWIFSIEFVLDLSLKITRKMLKESTAVLIHGRHSNSRSLLITSLVMIILDPEFRTYRGFHRLIFREWLCGAFNFSSRTKSVLFVMFLDCIWQLMQQFPTLFEFNEKLLLLLFCHSRSSKFGTFIGNSEYQRNLHKLADRTNSIWSFTMENYSKYSNSCYKPGELSVDHLSLQDLKVWTRLYGRGDHVPSAPCVRVSIDERINKLYSLSKQIHSLKKINETFLIN